MLIGIWQLLADFFREEEKELRAQVRRTVKESFPEQTREFSKQFGLFKSEADSEALDIVATNRENVVLVHGLDDPGKVWQVLRPRLLKEGFGVWLMQYPNDQPIAESARLFFEELEKLTQHGIHRIAIVAHSMGGLVSREMLTSPQIDFDRSVKAKRVPKVTTLIMVGTPNHGSQLARFQVLAEMREHVSRLIEGKSNWLGSLLDGAGEAAIDLLPESQLLAELNSRPHPIDVDMLIIAGISTPWNERDINHWHRNASQKASEDQKRIVDELFTSLISMSHTIGDGLVSVDSTRLHGVPHKTVKGTHLSIIRNVTENSQRVPPAVPIVVDHLKRVK